MHRHEDEDAHSAPAARPGAYGWAFGIGIALNVAYVLVEVICGLLVGSLALLADAGHNLSDVLSLFLAWGASRLQRIRPTERLPGVEEVHDLHIWAMSTTETALTAHLVKPVMEDEDRFLARVREELQDRFGIVHTTIQLERGRHEPQCRQAAEEVV